MLVAYSIYGNDNGAHYFEEAPESIFCPECGGAVDDDYVPSRLLYLNKQYDVSSTYDNRCIVTEEFKKFCEDNFPGTLSFRKVNGHPLLYVMHAHKSLAFDFERRKTRFEKKCTLCHRYAMVSGAAPGFLKNITDPILDGIYCSDIEFGSYKEKNTILMVGVNTMEKIMQKGFSGAEFSPVYGAGEIVTINGIEF